MCSLSAALNIKHHDALIECIIEHRDALSILVKKPSLVPFGSGSVTFFTFFMSRFLHQLLHQLRYHFFLQVGKCYIWFRPYRRGLRFGTYLGWNFRFGLWSRGQNVSKWLFFDTILRHVCYIDFYINWGTTFFQQVGKCYIWFRPYHRGLRFGTYLGWNFRFGLRSRGQNISKLLFFDTNAQIGSVRSCSNGLKFGMNIGLYMGQILG